MGGLSPGGKPLPGVIYLKARLNWSLHPLASTADFGRNPPCHSVGERMSAESPIGATAQG